MAEVEVENCCKVGVVGVVEARLSVGEEGGGLRPAVPGSAPWLSLTCPALPTSLLGTCAEEAMDGGWGWVAKKDYTAFNSTSSREFLVDLAHPSCRSGLTEHQRTRLRRGRKEWQC